MSADSDFDGIWVLDRLAEPIFLGYLGAHSSAPPWKDHPITPTLYYGCWGPLPTGRFDPVTPVLAVRQSAYPKFRGSIAFQSMLPEAFYYGKAYAGPSHLHRIDIAGLRESVGRRGQWAAAAPGTIQLRVRMTLQKGKRPRLPAKTLPRSSSSAAAASLAPRCGASSTSVALDTSRRQLPRQRQPRLGGDRFTPLDLTSSDAQDSFLGIVRDCASDGNAVSVISCMGSIGTSGDEAVNGALINAVRGAMQASDQDQSPVEVRRFVTIGNTDRVRDLARSVPFLRGYATGKDGAESALRKSFGDRSTIIKPSVIYGGDELSMSPPRIPSSLGGPASEVLGLYPLRALADALPGPLAVTLAPPVVCSMVQTAR
ncbi:hypothetical protein THAOC_21495 [Thalassiosira oceanica]|uniref:Uncharacterized protein n=1 Tax=Thalassiosira oceanica TaxID=159749 RepID=K0S0X7_THAOC|nr:hypothetical protein THAOC_21495 [Thalassiosira oceanica]|eukprot:EJK58389.1 hypothetical protein THAOC_21495 [Thalassiosira oceanica]